MTFLRPLVRIFLISFALLLLPVVGRAFAEKTPTEVEKQVSIKPRYDTQIDLDRRFLDSSGSETTLRELKLRGKPLLVTPVYYRCPMLCPLILKGVVELVNSLPLTLGEDYSIVSVTFNPEETPEIAADAAKKNYSELTNPEAGERGWHFLTGSEENIKALMDEVGFSYIPDGKEFAHSAVMIVISPEGKPSRYFYGVTFEPKEVRLALVDTVTERIGSPLDQVMLYCFQFDPQKGKYTLHIMNLMKAVCLSVLFTLCGTITWLKLKEDK